MNQSVPEGFAIVFGLIIFVVALAIPIALAVFAVASAARAREITLMKKKKFKDFWELAYTSIASIALSIAFFVVVYFYITSMFGEVSV